jgi:3-deoxy-7-phosphoheptulonate synthase
VKIGGASLAMIAGPCAVESRDQLFRAAEAVRDSGANMLRGGAFKPRSSPYAFQGLRERGLEILAEARDLFGLPVVSEVTSPEDVELVSAHVDVLQIGSRNMQNYPLLVEVGRARKPVLLKRGMAAGLCEWLGAAEYIANEGNFDIVLCERGIKAYPNGEYSRYSLDLNVIPAVKAETFLPVIVDPSHATGVSAMVEGASRAAVEFGAHGLIIEVASDRLDAAPPKCDAAQAITPRTLRRIIHYIDARHEQSAVSMHAA